MKAAKSLWDMSGWLIAGYTVYKHMQALNEAKNEFYTAMDPSQQARWDSIFGKPSGIVKPGPMVAVTSAMAQTTAPTLTQVLSGT